MKQQARRTIALFLLLPLSMLMFTTWIPFLQMIAGSFFSMSYTRNQGFIGLDNYIEVISTPQYNHAIAVSGYYMCAALIQTVLALLLAFLLMKCRFSGLYKSIFSIPYMISGVAVGYMFRLFYTRGFILDHTLQLLGFAQDTLPYWLRDQQFNNWALAFSSVWRYTGLNLIVYIGAIGAIDRTQFEASSLDGANRLQQFIHIVWPQIQSTVSLTLLLSLTSALTEFELPQTITSGGANGTATYLTLIYRIAFHERKIGLASSMVVVLLFQMIVFSLALFRLHSAVQKLNHREVFYDAFEKTPAYSSRPASAHHPSTARAVVPSAAVILRNGFSERS